MKQLQITLETACKNAAFPTACLWRFIRDSILRLSFSICLRFSSNFNFILSNCELITEPSFSESSSLTLLKYCINYVKLI